MLAEQRLILPSLEKQLLYRQKHNKGVVRFYGVDVVYSDLLDIQLSLATNQLFIIRYSLAFIHLPLIVELSCATRDGGHWTNTESLMICLCGTLRSL